MMFMYLIQVQAVLYAVISATSYYQFRGSTHFEIARGSYSQQCNCCTPRILYAKIQAESIWQHAKRRTR